MDALLFHDVRFALRRMRRRPVGVSLAVATLTLGMATAITFFGAADAILLRPLPISHPDRVMTIWRVPATSPEARTGLASGTLADLAEESRAFTTIAAAEPYGFDVPSVDGTTARATSAARVTEGFFDVLRIPPHMGRLLAPADFVPGGPPVVVVSYRFWSTRLAGDPAAVGAMLPLDGVPHAVVGVLPREFPVAEARDLYTPLVISGPARENRVADYFRTFGLLRPGVDPDAGLTELRQLAARSDARITGPQTPRELVVIPLTEALLGGVRGAMGLLALGAALVLLMAGASAVGLLTTDTMDRGREMAIRASIGAGRARIVRQLAIESLILSLLAGVLGFGAGAAGVRIFQRVAPADLPRLAELGMDLRLAAIAGATILGLTVLVALLPARLATRRDLHAELRHPGADRWGRAGRRTRLALVGSQVALATVLLGTGGLLVRSWMALQSEDVGYHAQGVVAVEQHAVWQIHPTEAARASFGREAVDRLSQRPGVESAALVSSLPLAPPIGNDQARVRRAETGVEVNVRGVVGTPGIFETLRVPFFQGRGFGPEDDGTGELVVIVSRTAAAILFPDEDPVGRTVDVAYSGPPFPRRIVGIVDDVRFASPAEPARPTVYLPHAQVPVGSLWFAARHRAVSPTTLAEMQSAVLELLPGTGIEDAVDLGALLQTATAPRRFATILLTAFSSIALTLTAVALFGVLAQSVRARRRELGIRMAVGAWPGALRNMVVAEGIRVSLVGLAVGLGAFQLGSGALRRVLYGVPTHDPVTLASVIVLVLTVACAASWWPAVQATKVDPVRMLRQD